MSKTQGTEQKVDEQTKEPEQTNDKGDEQKEAEKSSDDTPQITNDTVETDPVRKVVCKKLSTMFKESKERKKNRKRPLRSPKDEFKLPDVNPMYILTFIGLIIAGALYYTRKTAMKEERGRH